MPVPGVRRHPHKPPSFRRGLSSDQNRLVQYVSVAGCEAEASRRDKLENEGKTALPYGADEESLCAHVGAAKALRILQRKYDNSCGFGVGLYAAAIALPQLARSAGWSVHFTAFAIRGYIFLFLGIALQMYLIYMICKEERVNDKFGGQMHLCDLGAALLQCSESSASSACLGPGGTTITPSRLYNWPMWANRAFVRDALKAAFPERADEFEQSIDIGEYGLESYPLRLIVCFIFIIGLWGDLTETRSMLMVLWQIPTTHESWVKYDSASEDGEASGVVMRISGMPRYWKVFNALFVLLPKMCIWVLTVDNGVLFLMETAGIEDLVVNACALAFILNLDEILYDAMFSDVAKGLIDELEPCELDVEANQYEAESITELWNTHQSNRAWTICTFSLYYFAIPFRLVMMILITLFFLYKYYHEHCTQIEDGTWVPTPLHLPRSYNLPWASFIFGPFPRLFPIPTEENEAWSMPIDESGL